MSIASVGAAPRPLPFPTLWWGPTGAYPTNPSGRIPYGPPIIASASGVIMFGLMASAGSGSNSIALYRRGTALATTGVSSTGNWFTVSATVRQGDVIQPMLTNTTPGSGMTVSKAFVQRYIQRSGIGAPPYPTGGVPLAPVKPSRAVLMAWPGPCTASTNILTGPIATPNGRVGLWITQKSTGNVGIWGGSIGGQNNFVPAIGAGSTGFFLFEGVTSPFYVYSFSCDSSLVQKGWALGI